MAEWGKGTERYAEMMLHRARVAVETEGRIGALLWYQVRGERHRTEYGCWMGMLVRDLRADIGIPHLLVIQEAHSANGDSVQEG